LCLGLAKDVGRAGPNKASKKCCGSTSFCPLMEKVPDRRGSLTSRAGWKFAKEIGLLPPHARPGTPCLYDFWQKRGVIPTMT